MKSRLPLVEAPDSICILRLSALGDITHTVPVVRAIQRQWPETRITWICGAAEARLIEHIDGVRLIRFDKTAGWSAYRRLWKALANERFDVLLHMQVAARANIASIGVRADIRLGWDRQRSRDLHGLFVNHRVPVAQRQHQVLGFLSFAEALGIEPGAPRWDLPIPEEAMRFVERRVDPSRETLVLSPCSSHPRRNWSTQRYAEVADHVIDRHGMQVILSGGPTDFERTVAADIRGRMRNEALDLVGKLTLEQLPALLKAADLVLSPDAGPLHIASAVGTAVVGLHACTWSARSGAFNSMDYSVDRFAQAARQFRGREPAELRWGTRIEDEGVMDLITVEEVCDTVDRARADLARLR